MVMGPLGRPRPGNGGAGGSGAPGQAGEWDSDDRPTGVSRRSIHSRSLMHPNEM